MARVQTYVFIDLETTGLPKVELNKTRITELSMVAVKRQHLLDTRAGATPRVQHKLTLCFNPRRMIADECSEVTGLDNYLLENEPHFNNKVCNIIDMFLTILSKPVCLIAHNGLAFDYPILKNHLVKLNVELSSDLLCADSYHGFYHIEQKLTLQLEEGRKEQETSPTNDPVISPTNGSVISPTYPPEVSPTKESVIAPTTATNVDKIGYQTTNISMQAINETTPKTNKTLKPPQKSFKAKRRLFPWGGGPKPALSYKLKDIYARVLNKPAIDSHRAENDCMFTLEISVALSKQFVEWVDNNHENFSDIVPMAIGVPM